MKRAFKILAWLIGIPLLLILLAVGLVAWLAGTDKGFELATDQIAKRVPGLDLGEVGGNLNRGIASDSVRFANDAMQVDVAGLDSEWRTRCLLKREFCLDSLTIDEVRFEQLSVAEKEETEPGPIELPAVSLPIDVTVTELRINRFVFQAVGDVPEQVVENIHLSASTEGSTVTIDDLAAVYQNYGVGAQGTVELDGDYPLDLDLALTADDVFEEFDATVDVALDNSVRDLDFDVVVGGLADARLAGRVQPLDSELPLKATLSSDLVGWPLNTQQVAAVRDLTLGIDGTLDDYLLDLDAAVSGEQVPDTTLAIDGRVNTERADVSEIGIDTLGGTVNGNAVVDWTNGIDWLTAITLDGIEPGQQVEGIDGAIGGVINAAGTVVDGDWTLALDEADFNGALNGYPFELVARAHKTDPESLVIDELILDNGANQIRGGGSLALAEGARSDLQVSAKLPELENLVPDLSGNITADLNVQGELATPDVTLDAVTNRIRFQDYEVRGLRLTTDVAEAALQDSTLRLTIAEIDAAGQMVQNLKLNATGTRAEHRLSFFADGPEATAADITLAGGLSDSFDWAGELRSVVLDVPAHTITLESPTALEWNQQDKLFGMDAHCWQTEDTNLCLENKVYAAPEGSARITLDTYPMARLNPFLPAESTVDGTLGLATDVTWGPEVTGGFEAVVNTELQEGSFTVRDAYDDPVTFSYDTITLNATADPEDVKAQLDIDSKTLGAARVDIELDAGAEDKPISGDVSLDGLDIAVIEAFLPDFDEFGGVINAQGRVSGTLTEPAFNGDVVLDGLVVRGELLPLDIDEGRIVTQVRGQRADISGAINAGEGTLDIDGSANWRGDSWQADVSIDGKQLNIVSDPLIESDINPNITIAARPNSIRVGGSVDIPSALIDVGELPAGAATLSDDIVVIEDIDEDTVEEEVQAATGDTDLRVNVDILLGDDVELSAYGLNANLTGDIGVSLRSPDPVNLSGEIEVVDGIYKQYGQDLAATGRILFVGPVASTRLDIQAVREITAENRTAGLKIEGRVEEPEISLYTDPSDKGDESILSYIVLGRDINETSDSDSNLLAAAALALGVKGGKVVGGNIAESLGIKDFGFETSGSGDNTQLVVSGRVTDKLLVKYGRSVFDTESTLYLRYDLTKKLYVEAAEGVEQAVDLFYEFSF